MGASKNAPPSGGRFGLVVRGDLDLTLGQLAGFGPKSVAKLESRGVTSLLDLLTLFPNRYERTLFYPRGAHLEAERPEHIVFRGVVTSVRKPQRGSRQPLEVIVSCDGERVVLVWFHIPGSRFADGFQRGRALEVAGAVDWSRSLGRIVHPRTRWVGEEPAGPTSVRWEPIYPAVEGVAAKRLRAAIVEAFGLVEDALVDVVPPTSLADLQLGTIRDALAALHAIGERDASDHEPACARARTRIVYEELYTLQRTFASQRMLSRATARAPQCARRAVGRSLARDLPFALTSDQRNTLSMLADGLSRPVAMRCLLQGDVGSGKTIVALLLAAIALESGVQVALLAPTEVLARQHFDTARKLYGDRGMAVRYLGGSLSSAERRSVSDSLASDEPMLVIGTHALCSTDVTFANLGFVIIDEQHKFGVDQREDLLAKGVDPHLLAMTATPIPRSLAHAVFGDLDLAVLRERPPGREPVRTYLRDRGSRPALYEWIADTVVAKGQQAFIVFPAIEDDARGFRPLLAGSEELANGWLRGCRVGVLHGQMGGEDKLAVMKRFAEGALDVLCATTVVEVGVDVSNATVMVIESAEAFGLSQLHQLRGRVGRGHVLSRCVLVCGDGASASARDRLQFFESTDDGFELAERDLVVRGPGEFLGARQSGAAEFRFADLVRDAELLARARFDAYLEVFGDLGASGVGAVSKR